MPTAKEQIAKILQEQPDDSSYSTLSSRGNLVGPQLRAFCEQERTTRPPSPPSLDLSPHLRHIHSMLTLIQLPWSPFCIAVRHILERNGIPFRLRNIPYHERTSIITVTKGRGHSVPCIVDGNHALCDTTDFGQEVARYINRRHHLKLFPKQFEGIQLILSRYIENDLEMVGFKVNDTYVIPSRPLIERVMLIRHKERKFGKGCLQEWASHRKYLTNQFAASLMPIDNMLASSSFLLSDRPLFVDYNLYGVIGNYLFNGKTKLPNLKHLRRWHRQMNQPS